LNKNNWKIVSHTICIQIKHKLIQFKQKNICKSFINHNKKIYQKESQMENNISMNSNTNEGNNANEQNDLVDLMKENENFKNKELVKKKKII